MEKIYRVILEDVNSGDSTDISINNCGLPMVKHHAEIFCKQNNIKIISKRCGKYCVPSSKRDVVWLVRGLNRLF